MKRAARIGDAWLIVNATALGATDAADADLPRRAARNTAGPPIEFPIARECYVGEQPRHRAWTNAAAPLEYKYNAYAAWGMEAQQREARSRSSPATVSSSATRCR